MVMPASTIVLFTYVSIAVVAWSTTLPGTPTRPKSSWLISIDTVFGLVRLMENFPYTGPETG